ncbi:MAG: cupredoxin domain-containing protein [Telluria sp.]
MIFRMAAAMAAAFALAGTVSAEKAIPAVHTVLIDGMRFIPQTLEVKPGDTVIWRNKDPFPHTATGAAGGPASPAIAAGASWKFTAKKRGNYPYVCTLHPTMTATLVVK